MDDTRRRDLLLATVAASLLPTASWAADPAVAQPAGGDASDGGGLRPGEAWVASWAASVQGPYPVGNPSAQPDQRFAFPVARAGARDQTFRLIVQPDLWGRQARLRFSNAFGTRPVTFDGVFVGLQLGGAALVAGTNRPVQFGGSARASRSRPARRSGATRSRCPSSPIPPRRCWRAASSRSASTSSGESGPDDLARQGAADLLRHRARAPARRARTRARRRSPSRTTSWFFLDAVDVTAPAGTPVIVAFGDSITDGTASTMNGDDRWPDVLAAPPARGVRQPRRGGERRHRRQPGASGPPTTRRRSRSRAALGRCTRLERDVLGLSGVTAVIWLEGINDFGERQRHRRGGAGRHAARASAASAPKLPGVRVIGATLISALGSTNAAHGSPEQDEKRKALNAFIRTSGLFDAVADFDAATLDPATGGLRPELVPEVHHRRAGRQAAPEPRRLPGDGGERGPRQRGARAAEPVGARGLVGSSRASARAPGLPTLTAPPVRHPEPVMNVAVVSDGPRQARGGDDPRQRTRIMDQDVSGWDRGEDARRPRADVLRSMSRTQERGNPRDDGQATTAEHPEAQGPASRAEGSGSGDDASGRSRAPARRRRPVGHAAGGAHGGPGRAGPGRAEAVQEESRGRTSDARYAVDRPNADSSSTDPLSADPPAPWPGVSATIWAGGQGDRSPRGQAQRRGRG